MTQAVRGFPVEDAICVIDQWFLKQKPYSWKACPREVKAAMRQAAGADGWLDHRVAVSILQEAETPSTTGSANAGMAWIRQEWLKPFPMQEAEKADAETAISA